ADLRQGPGDRPDRGSLGVHGVPAIHPCSAFEPEGLHLLHVEQSEIPRFHAGVVRMERGGGRPIAIPAIGAAATRSVLDKSSRTLGRSIRSGAGFFVHLLRRRPMFAAGYVIVLAVVLLAVFAPWVTPYSPVTANPADYLQPPSWHHPFGTDATGMDVFSRSIYAPRIDLTIAVIGT